VENFSPQEFTAAMDVLKGVSPKAWTYLNAMDPKVWARHAWIKEGAVCFDLVTSNGAEHLNSKNKPIRYKAPYQVLKDICMSLMKDINKAREAALDMETDNMLLTPFADRVYREQEVLAAHCSVDRAGDHIA
jgi:hypothetical protein